MPEDDEGSEDNRKWVGVRLSKAMMHQVEDAVEGHPEYAWSTPNDFVRDAVRRHLEYVRQQEYLKQGELMALPERVEDVLKRSLGDKFAGEFERRLAKATKGIDPAKDPRTYIQAVTALLSSTLGPTMAKVITDGMTRGKGEGK